MIGRWRRTDQRGRSRSADPVAVARVPGRRRGAGGRLEPEPWPADSLQLIGDGLLAAVRDGIDGSADLARTCVNALRGAALGRRP